MLRVVVYDVEWEEVSGVATRGTYAFICFRLLYHAFQMPSYWSPDLFVISVVVQLSPRWTPRTAGFPKCPRGLVFGQVVDVKVS